MAAVGYPMAPTTSRTGLEVVASFDDYAAAQRAVDRVADVGFPVERLSIVGNDLTLVENITGRLGYGRVAGEGALSGGLIAGFIGVLFGVLNWFDPADQQPAARPLRARLRRGGRRLLGVFLRWMTQGARDFSSVRSMTAARFELLGPADMADDARARLAA